MRKGFDFWISIFSTVGLILFSLPVLSLVFSASPLKVLQAFLDKEFANTLYVSFLCATLSTLLIIFFGTPLAYLLSKREFTFKSWLEHLIDLPIVIPHSVSGIAILHLFGRTTLLGRFLEFLGLRVYGSHFGIVLAMGLVSAPYFIGTLKEGFSLIPEEYEKISYSLGHGKFYTFFRVLLPLARGSFFKGLILSWGRALSEFGAVMVVAYFPMTATVFIYERLETMGIRATLPYAVAILLLSGTIFIVSRILWRHYAEGSRSQG